jgi:hypothetical protein
VRPCTVAAPAGLKIVAGGAKATTEAELQRRVRDRVNRIVKCDANDEY